jgi:hypothetical protein
MIRKLLETWYEAIEKCGCYFGKMTSRMINIMKKKDEGIILPIYFEISHFVVAYPIKR